MKYKSNNHGDKKRKGVTAGKINKLWF